MSVFDLARARATYVREHGGTETAARLVHAATLGNSMLSMIDGAVADGWFTRAEGERALADAARYMQAFERNEVRID